MAAIVEFKMRLFAENQLNFQAKDLGDIENKLFQWLKDLNGLENFVHWKTIRQLRNKILHSEFQQAKIKLQELGHATGKGLVKKLNIDGMNLGEILATVD